MSTTPYPNGYQQVVMVLLGVFGAITVGVWRGFIYDFGAGEWALVLFAGALGVIWSAVVLARRPRHAQGLLPVALVIAFVLEVFRRRLGLSPELATALWLFGGGALLVFGAEVTWGVVSRRIRVRRRLSDAGGLRDPSIKAQLDTYFAASSRVEGQLRPFQKALTRRFRRLSRKPGPSWQAAASALRSYVAALDSHTEATRSIPYPTCLEERAQANGETTSVLREECLRLASSLESGERPDLARARDANRRALEAGRDWQYAVGMLAAHHRVSVPRWFLKLNCQYAKAG